MKKQSKLKLENFKLVSFVTRLDPSPIKGGRPPHTAGEGICSENC